MIDVLGGNTLEGFDKKARELSQALIDPNADSYALYTSCRIYSSVGAQIALGKCFAVGENPQTLLREAWIVGLAGDRFREVSTYETAKSFQTFSEWEESRLYVDLKHVNYTVNRSAGLFLLGDHSEVERASHYLMAGLARRDDEYWRKDSDYSPFLESGPNLVAALSGINRPRYLAQLKDIEPFSSLWAEGIDDACCEDTLRALCDWHLAMLARSWRRSRPVYYTPDFAIFPTWIFALARLRFSRDAATLGDIHPLLDIGREILSGPAPEHDSELVRAIEKAFEAFAKRYAIGPQELVRFWTDFRDT